MLLKPAALTVVARRQRIDLGEWLRFNQGLDRSVMAEMEAKF